MINKKLILLLISSILIGSLIVTCFGFNNPIQEIKATTEHPFLVDGNWVVASQLKLGDNLTTIDGKQARILSIEKIVQNVSVYNFETQENDYVADGVVVHNSNFLLINRPLNEEVLRGDIYRAGRFMDKEHWELALQGKNPEGIPKGLLKTQPWCAYGCNEWGQWSNAEKWLYQAARGENWKGGKIDEDLIIKIGTFFKETKYRELDIMSSTEASPQAAASWIKVGRYGPGEFETYDELYFLQRNSDVASAMKNNPYMYYQELDAVSYPGAIANVRQKLVDVGNTEWAGLIDSGEASLVRLMYSHQQDVPKLMQELLVWYNQQISGCKPFTQEKIIEIAAEFQRRYVTIHPFEDKNGRTSRLLMDYIIDSLSQNLPVYQRLPSPHLIDTSRDIFSTPGEWKAEVEKGIRRGLEDMGKLGAR